MYRLMGHLPSILLLPYPAGAMGLVAHQLLTLYDQEGVIVAAAELADICLTVLMVALFYKPQQLSSCCWMSTFCLARLFCPYL